MLLVLPSITGKSHHKSVELLDMLKRIAAYLQCTLTWEEKINFLVLILIPSL